MTSAETSLYQFLAAEVTAAEDGEDLFELEVHDTVHQEITKVAGLRVGDGSSLLVPGPDNAIKEFDADVELVVFVKIPGNTPKDRLASRDRSLTIAAAVAKAIYDNNTLGSRVCDCMVGTAARGYDNIKTVTFAVVNIALLINPSGERAA